MDIRMDFDEYYFKTNVKNKKLQQSTSGLVK